MQPEQVKITDIKSLSKAVKMNGAVVLNWASEDLLLNKAYEVVLKIALKNYLKNEYQNNATKDNFMLEVVNQNSMYESIKKQKLETLVLNQKPNNDNEKQVFNKIDE